MARIRSIKPEFWEDEKVGSLTPLARLLFIGSWNLADDEGLLRWTADYLNASLFMYDGLTSSRVEKLMREVVGADLVFPYASAATRQQLAYVTNFRKHQRINRPQPGKFPPPRPSLDSVRDMYGRRDGWICHLCKGPINTTRAYSEPRYPADGSTIEPGFVDLNLSLDHLIPKVQGGDDYPSNIAASHVACNKGRGSRPVHEFSVPPSVTRALSHSVNGDVNGSPPSRAPAVVEVEQGSGAGSREVEQVRPAPPAPPDGAQQLIAEWIDHTPKRPPNAVIGQVGKQLAAMLAEGQDPDDLRRALAAWSAKGLHPSTLPSVVHEVANSSRTNGRPSTTDAAVTASLRRAAELRAQEHAS